MYKGIFTKKDLLNISERSITVDGFLSPEGGPDITDKELSILGNTYASCREDKKKEEDLESNKTKCSKIAWSAVNKYDSKNESIVKTMREAEDEEEKSRKAIKDLIATKWSGSNQNQMKAVQLLKGLALADTKVANDFMKDLDNLTSKMDANKYK